MRVVSPPQRCNLLLRSDRRTSNATPSGRGLGAVATSSALLGPLMMHEPAAAGAFDKRLSTSRGQDRAEEGGARQTERTDPRFPPTPAPGSKTRARCGGPRSAGVKSHRLSLITAKVPAFGAGAPNYTAQPQQGRRARESFVRLIICLGLVIAARTGTQVIVW